MGHYSSLTETDVASGKYLTVSYCDNGIHGKHELLPCVDWLDLAGCFSLQTRDLR